MSTSHSTCATEKDLQKFLKFLAFKSIQVVVQSRLGELLHTQCGPPTGNDWFNVVVEEHPEISADTKWGFSMKPGETILQRLPFFIEISLKTSEGDTMILEVWSMDLQRPKDTDKVDSGSEQCLKQSHAIYNRMGVLLKSLITLTRTTPAYKLSRRQCADSYRIQYRIYFDQPQLHTLGEGHKFVRIGQLNTILGNLVISLAYRTKMTITPTTTTIVGNCTRENNVIMMDSNHFRPLDGTPKQHYGFELCMKKGFNGSGEVKIIDIEKPLRPGAFTDVAKIKQYTEEDFVLPETPPFEWLLRKPRHESTGSGGTLGSIESLNRKCDSPVASPLGNGYQHNINNNAANNNINNSSNTNITVNNNNNNHNNNINNNGNDLKNNQNSENSQQHKQQTQRSPNNSTHSQSNIKSLFIPVPPTARHSSAPHLRRTHAAALSADDENLLKELNFPFASHTSHVNDLAKFYRDCYHAPPLCGLGILESEITDNVTTTDASKATVTNSTDAPQPNHSLAGDDLSKQLEQFETSLEDYDELVSQFGILNTSSSSN